VRSVEIHVFRSDQFSLLMYRCLLPSSVTVKMDYVENMENARYATNDDTSCVITKTDRTGKREFRLSARYCDAV
jgi:hypothetical protein